MADHSDAMDGESAPTDQVTVHTAPEGENPRTPLAEAGRSVSVSASSDTEADDSEPHASKKRHRWRTTQTGSRRHGESKKPKRKVPSKVREEDSSNEEEILHLRDVVNPWIREHVPLPPLSCDRTSFNFIGAFFSTILITLLMFGPIIWMLTASHYAHTCMELPVPTGRRDGAPGACLAFGPALTPDEQAGAGPLRCTFYCGNAVPVPHAACLVEEWGLVLDMNLLQLAPEPGDLACKPALEQWTWGSEPGERLSCRWTSVRLDPYGLLVDDPDLALALQLAKDEAALLTAPHVV